MKAALSKNSRACLRGDHAADIVVGLRPGPPVGEGWKEARKLVPLQE